MIKEHKLKVFSFCKLNLACPSYSLCYKWIKWVGSWYICHCLYGFLVWCLTLPDLKTTLYSTLFITFSTIEYLVSIKLNCLHGRPIIFQLLIQLFCLPCYSITIKPSKAIKNTSSFVYYLLFIFTLRKGGPAKIWLAGLVAMTLVTSCRLFYEMCFCTNSLLKISECAIMPGFCKLGHMYHN